MDATYTLAFTDAADAPYALAASPDYARDGACFAACSSGLYRSQDGGQRWELLRTSSEALTTAVAVSPAFAEDRAVFAAVKGGVLRSSDGGETWFTSRFAAPPPLFSSLIAAPDFERDGFLLAATLEDGGIFIIGSRFALAAVELRLIRPQCALPGAVAGLGGR